MSNRMNSEPNNMEMEFCALKYGLPDSFAGTDSGDVILLAVKSEDALELYLHRAFEQRTDDRDLRYMNELLPDLLRRSRRTPDAAFRQLSHLSVGPLVTGEVGHRDFSLHPVESLYPDLRLMNCRQPSPHMETVSA